MPERSVEEENTLAKEKRLSVIRDRARIFREVLGSPRGALVLDALRANFGFDGTGGIPPNITDDHGRTDEWQTARKLGVYSVIRYIELQLEWKESEHVNTSGPGT
jgi:hypothetical protein